MISYAYKKHMSTHLQWKIRYNAYFELIQQHGLPIVGWFVLIVNSLFNIHNPCLMVVCWLLNSHIVNNFAMTLPCTSFTHQLHISHDSLSIDNYTILCKISQYIAAYCSGTSITTSIVRLFKIFQRNGITGCSHLGMTLFMTIPLRATWQRFAQRAAISISFYAHQTFNIICTIHKSHMSITLITTPCRSSSQQEYQN